ncbi:hypothetical protein J7T55_002702 [Diaporthe amygdali]|uniref:uncharacterized protein n=1 Tax=Phomopsis amygdali TaxID=1214568 RepID=UPI0022FE5F47|nr:uncharacterized protein J7T55_002702 [Diaporthe amygdali]KAJ0122190.1 hypothetical protein J7T55_002702 [Diaporthe amygdali]
MTDARHQHEWVRLQSVSSIMISLSELPYAHTQPHTPTHTPDSASLTTRGGSAFSPAKVSASFQQNCLWQKDGTAAADNKSQAGRALQVKQSSRAPSPSTPDEEWGPLPNKKSIPTMSCKVIPTLQHQQL